jgi:hypothetical protein
MSSKTATVFICDLCGRERDPSQLRRLRTDKVRGEVMRTRGADVCDDCQARPIGELLEYFGKMEAASASREEKE